MLADVNLRCISENVTACICTQQIANERLPVVVPVDQYGWARFYRGLKAVEQKHRVVERNDVRAGRECLAERLFASPPRTISLQLCLYLKNYRFAQRSVDYFELEAGSTPVRHYWSQEAVGGEGR